MSLPLQAFLVTLPLSTRAAAIADGVELVVSMVDGGNASASLVEHVTLRPAFLPSGSKWGLGSVDTFTFHCTGDLNADGRMDIILGAKPLLGYDQSTVQMFLARSGVRYGFDEMDASDTGLLSLDMQITGCAVRRIGSFVLCFLFEGC